MKIFLTPRCPLGEYLTLPRLSVAPQGQRGVGEQALPVGWFLCAPSWAKMVQTSWVKGEGALQASVLLIQALQVDLYKAAAWLATL